MNPSLIADLFYSASFCFIIQLPLSFGDGWTRDVSHVCASFAAYSVDVAAVHCIPNKSLEVVRLVVRYSLHSSHPYQSFQLFYEDRPGHRWYCPGYSCRWLREKRGLPESSLGLDLLARQQNYCRRCYQNSLTSDGL